MTFFKHGAILKTFQGQYTPDISQKKKKFWDLETLKSDPGSDIWSDKISETVPFSKMSGFCRVQSRISQIKGGQEQNMERFSREKVEYFKRYSTKS